MGRILIPIPIPRCYVGSDLMTAGGIAEWAEQLQQASSLERRLHDLDDRLHAAARDSATLEGRLTHERRQLRRLRWGARGLWLGLLGQRAERLLEAHATIERVERQHRTKRELFVGLEAERAEAAASTAALPSPQALRDTLESATRSSASR